MSGSSWQGDICHIYSEGLCDRQGRRAKRALSITNRCD